MNKRQEQQIVDYYSTTDRYIRSDRYSDSNQTVFTKENDRYQWLVLEQKSQHDVEIRQTDSHGTITARDNYELTRNIPKCVGVERLCKDANMQIPFTADEINLIYQFGEQSKAEAWQKDRPLSVTVQTDMTTFSEGLSSCLHRTDSD